MNKEGKKTNTLESILSIDVINKDDYAKQEEGIGDMFKAAKHVAGKAAGAVADKAKAAGKAAASAASGAAAELMDVYRNSQLTSYMKKLSGELQAMEQKWNPKFEKLRAYVEKDAEMVAAFDAFDAAFDKMQQVIAARTQGK